MRMSALKRKSRGAGRKQEADVVDVLSLAAQLSTRGKLDNVSSLLQCIQGQDESAVVAACLQLQQFFATQLRQEAFLTAAKPPAEGGRTAEQQLLAWLQNSYAVLLDRLVALLCRDDVTVQTQFAALESLLEFCRCESAGSFSNKLYERVLLSLLRSSACNSELLGALCKRFLAHPDVSLYTWTSLRKLFESTATAADEDALRNAFDLLCSVPATFSAAEEEAFEPWCGWQPPAKRAVAADGPAGGAPRWLDPARRRHAFSEAWLVFLRLPLPADLYKKVLSRLHVLVIPHLTNPLLLSDFLTRAVDLGSLLGILALNGLFILMTQHGLEYPSFYVRLYALLEPGLFHARHRRQFFALLEVFLRSTHLPAYLAAAFAKRLSRLALSAPPHGCMLAIGFVHNLLRRHPGCCVLLHRTQQTGEVTSASDPFLEDEADPAQCHALESSLWELDTMRSHYSPSVARFVAVLDKDLTDKRKTFDVDLAALGGASYATMVSEELERRLKTVPLAFYASQEAEPAGLWGGDGSLEYPYNAVV